MLWRCSGKTATNVESPPVCWALRLSAWTCEPGAVLARPCPAESKHMTEEAGPGGNELSPTDAAIIEMIREGRYDAEIASRLFISTADVKARIERLLAQGGLHERSDFITPPKPEQEPPASDAPPFERQPRMMSVHNAVLAVVCALAIGVGVGWVVRDEQSDRVERASDQSVVRPADDLPSGADDSFTSGDFEELLRLLRSGVIALPQTSPLPRAAAWELGSLFTADGVSAVDSLSYDGDGRQIVQLVEPSTIETAGLTEWTVQRRTTGELTLTTKVRDRVVILRLETLDEKTRFDREGTTVRVSTTDGSRPRFQLWVDGAQWSLGLDGRLVVYL